MESAGVSLDLYRASINKIVKSECFRSSRSLRHLLEYLGEKTLNNEADELKEYTIGVEACGKPASYDPQKDAAVRVQIGRLRQKLQEYNEADGALDPVSVEVPKGRFSLLFHHRQGEQESSERPPESPLGDNDSLLLAEAPVNELPPRATSSSYKYLLLLTGAVLGGAIAWAVMRTDMAGLVEQKATVQSTSLWRSYFLSGAPNVMIFGSPTFFASEKHQAFLRLWGVADMRSKEFQEMNEKIGPLDGPRYDYASMGDAVAAQRLTVAFASSGLMFRAIPAHMANWDSLQDCNLVFLGAPRMNALMQRLPIRQDFELGPDNYIHNKNPKAGEQTVYRTTSHRNAVSYAVVATYPGLRPGREIMIITAHSSAGMEGGVGFVTSKEGISTIKEKIKLVDGKPRHFQMLLRIFADTDEPIETEYVTHHLDKE
jgi:hypothetical protein